MMTPKKYNAKILLFGEHAVLKGSDAIAIPFSKFGGKWVYTRYPEMAKMKQMELPQFFQYLKEKSGSVDFFDINTEDFGRELLDGMYFQSNIPLGYGAGSSGSLCAAIYDSFAKKKTTDVLQLKKIFSIMESFFHGSSSGFDPLISYLNQAIKISSGEMETINDIPLNSGLFLIDTGIKRTASDFINGFMKKCEGSEYLNLVQSELIPLNQKAIQSYLKGDATSLFHHMHDISRFQYLHFNEMIPDNMVAFWEKGLKGRDYKMKVCGAGGGGFMIGMTNDMKKAKKIFKEVELIEV